MTIVCKVILAVALFVGVHAQAAEVKSAPANWQASMQALSQTLTDAFPFLYSRSEFRDPANRSALMKSFDQLAQAAHVLPIEGGQVYLGSEPLIKQAKDLIQQDFSRARDLYKAKKYTQAQVSAQRAIQNCFACHTAHQVGPSYLTTNTEVMGVATPFLKGKIIVYGAIRQFGGALEWIEQLVAKSKGEKGFPIQELTKLHLVVSLRGLQDFERAQKFLQTVESKLSKNADFGKVIVEWKKDIQIWATKPDDAKNSEGKTERNFVAKLQESLVLHKKIAQKSMTKTEKAQLFLRLGTIYEDLGISELHQLKRFYFDACVEEKASPELTQACTAR